MVFREEKFCVIRKYRGYVGWYSENYLKIVLFKLQTWFCLKPKSKWSLNTIVQHQMILFIYYSTFSMMLHIEKKHSNNTILSFKIAYYFSTYTYVKHCSKNRLLNFFVNAKDLSLHDAIVQKCWSEMSSTVR